MFILRVNVSATSIVQNRSAMRTPHTKSERKQTMPQAAIKHHGFFATALGALLLVVALAAPALAVDSIWNASPQSGDWNQGINWNTGMPPVMAGDTAAFNTSNITSLFLSGDVTIDSMTFNSGADAFSIETNGHSFSFVNGGIVNNSINTQTITNTAGTISFLNSSTAGNATIINSLDGSGFNGGVTNFGDASTSADAGNAMITNAGGGIISGGTTKFFNSSSASNATITNEGATFAGLFGGATQFLNDSTAGNATITNNGGVPPLGGVYNPFTSPNGSFIAGGSTTFQNNSNAGNATITNNGGTGSLLLGGSTTFQDTSQASNATLIANGGSGGGFGGTISFEGDSTGDTARVEVFGNGNLDISGHNAPGLTLGSIEGDGNVFLGANNLTVGSNNLSTLFSGVISDVGKLGSLTKVGTGTLTLTGINTYTGITTINAGVLSISSDANLGIAPSPAPARRRRNNWGHRRQYLELRRRDHGGRVAHQNRYRNADPFWCEHLHWRDDGKRWDLAGRSD